MSQSAVDWLQILSLGAIVGAAGQGARVIVGLKKLNDAASTAFSSVSALIEPSRLIISLMIGAISGVLAATQFDAKSIDASVILGIAAAGYTGADFIEGFVRRTVADPGAAVGSDAKGAASASSSAPTDPSDDAAG